MAAISAPPAVVLTSAPEAIPEIAKAVVVAFVVVELPVITKLPLMVEEAEERKPARVVAPVRVAPPIVGEVPNTKAPLPVSSVTRAASSVEVSIEVLPSLPLKRDQSAEESFPVFAAEAVGKLYVIVLPEAVMVKSVPVVEVARVTVLPVCVWPAGPMAVMPLPPLPEMHVSFIEKHPAVRLMPFAAVEVAEDPVRLR